MQIRKVGIRFLGAAGSSERLRQGKLIVGIASRERKSGAKSLDGGTGMPLGERLLPAREPSMLQYATVLAEGVEEKIGRDREADSDSDQAHQRETVLQDQPASLMAV